MSRPLKFRAWDKKYNEGIPLTHASIRLDGKLDLPPHYEEENVIVEQCTGLKDKNGKEIYEGDIVRVSYGYNYEVRQFRTGAWRIGRDDLCVWADSSEVIGNIHENPELLGGEE